MLPSLPDTRGLPPAPGGALPGSGQRERRARGHGRLRGLPREGGDDGEGGGHEGPSGREESSSLGQTSAV